MRKVFAWVAGLVSAWVLATHVAIAAPTIDLKEGQWRIEMEMTLPGKGPQIGGPLFRDMCLTPSNLIQILIPEGAPCQGAVTSQTAKSMDWKMTCNQGQTVTDSKGHFEFAEERLAGVVLTTAPRYGMEFKTIIKGKYLGACPLTAAEPKAQAPAAKTAPKPASPPLPSFQP